MPLDLGRITHLLEQMHRSEDDSGVAIVVDKVLVTDGAAGFTWEDYSGSAGGPVVVIAHGSMGATETFVFSAPPVATVSGPVHTGTLNANLTATLSGSTSGEFAEWLLILTQDGTGGRTITWPAAVVDPPTMDTTAGTTSAVYFYSTDGGTTIYTGDTGGGGPSSLVVQDEGTPLATDATTLNFVGAGVTATGAGATKTITIPSDAPTTADYLVGTAQGGLSAEIVVGTTPGGELGNTWASPTVDTTHSGSSHAGVITTHEAAADPHTGYLKEADIAAKGDLFVGTANDTVGILSVGSNNQVLVADSAQTTGTKWAAVSSVDPSGFTWIHATADEDANNVANQDHTQFQFPVTAGKHYIVNGYFLCSGNSTVGDFEYRILVTAGTMEGRGGIANPDATLNWVTTGLAVVATANSGNVAVGTAVANDLGFPQVALMWFSFRHNTTNATFKVQFGVNALTATRVARMMQGSYIQYKQTD